MQIADIDCTYRGRGARHFTAIVAGHRAELEYVLDAGTQPWRWFVQKPDGSISSRGRADSRTQAGAAALSVAIGEARQGDHLSEEQRRDLGAKALCDLIFEQ